MTILVTGGAGFIGANFVLDWFDESNEPIVTMDALTYAGHPDNLARLAADGRHTFIEGDICDGRLITDVLEKHSPRAIVHFAAESHVDRSIEGPAAFMQTNVMGTFTLLEAARKFRSDLSAADAAAFRFLHVSTDEVYGTLGPDDAAFSETSNYAPNSPYSASKAGSDHLVRAWFHTYGLPVLTTNCTNNYGPRQFPEKLIPVVIGKALAREPVPIYGDGQNVRDWIHVSDHCAGIRAVLANGEPGESYNLSAECERNNVQLAQTVCDLVDELAPEPGKPPRRELLTFVEDRAGHDFRYAMQSAKARDMLGWTPEHSFEDGLRATVRWYLDNHEWVVSARNRVEQTK
ncbi:MAG: dTDP-glucose 4,6-dehydratase [Pseudomonadota bacterium]